MLRTKNRTNTNINCELIIVQRKRNKYDHPPSLTGLIDNLSTPSTLDDTNVLD